MYAKFHAYPSNDRIMGGMLYYLCNPRMAFHVFIDKILCAEYTHVIKICRSIFIAKEVFYTPNFNGANQQLHCFLTKFTSCYVQICLDWQNPNILHGTGFLKEWQGWGIKIAHELEVISKKGQPKKLPTRNETRLFF